MPAPAVSPIVAALDHPEVTLDRDTAPVAALSLVEAFAQIPDPRKARGIRHGVLAIVLLGACAVLTGARSFAAIGEYAHDTGRAILDRLGVGTVVPHASTIRRVLQDLDPGAVEAAMRTWALAQLADRPAPDGVPTREQRQVLALDGKTVRGAHIPTSTTPSTAPHRRRRRCGARYRQPHLVSVLDQASGAVLGQVQVEAKGSEVAAFTTLLDELDLTDVLVTADAVHTNRNHADYLHERGGHYLLTAKLNQPTLLRRLRALPWKQIGVAGRERGRGHGRVETRSDQRRVPAPVPGPGWGVLPARRPGHQGRPPPPRPGQPEVDHGHRLRDHLAHRPAGRPGAAGPLAARALGDRGAALGPRCDLRRGPLPGPHRQRTRRSWPRYAFSELDLYRSVVVCWPVSDCGRGWGCRGRRCAGCGCVVRSGRVCRRRRRG